MFTFMYILSWPITLCGIIYSKGNKLCVSCSLSHTLDTPVLIAENWMLFCEIGFWLVTTPPIHPQNRQTSALVKISFDPAEKDNRLSKSIDWGRGFRCLAPPTHPALPPEVHDGAGVLPFVQHSVNWVVQRLLNQTPANVGIGLCRPEVGPGYILHSTTLGNSQRLETI